MITDIEISSPISSQCERREHSWISSMNMKYIKTSKKNGKDILKGERQIVLNLKYRQLILISKLCNKNNNNNNMCVRYNI